MPTWGQILKELEDTRAGNEGNPDFDKVRRAYLARLHQHVGDRAVILYASAFMEGRPATEDHLINLMDKQAMMEVVSNISERNLDLILHTPGGLAEGAEAVLEYLRTRFDHIRAIVPLAAMSAGTMLAMGCDEIVLGAHSQLGPTDPQLTIRTSEGPRSAPAEAILRQFERAKEEIAANPAVAGAWYPILGGYGPGLLTICTDQRALTEELVGQWLAEYMLSDHPTPHEEAAAIATWLAAYSDHKTHGRPIARDELREHGVKVIDLEEDDEFQDLVLSVHHSTMHTLSSTPTSKLVENHHGRAFVRITMTPGLLQLAGPAQAGPPADSPGARQQDRQSKPGLPSRGSPKKKRR